MSEISDWLAAYVCAPDFIERYPYYAAILTRLTPVDDPSVPFAAVSWADERIFLHVNVGYLQRNPQHLRGLLLHEVHHVVLGHLTEPRCLEAAHPDLMEMAMEASANEYIREQLPPGALTWQRLSHCGVEAGQSTLERYERLAAARRAGAGPNGVEGLLFADVGWRRPGPRSRRTNLPVSALERLVSAAIEDVRSRRLSPVGDAALVAGRLPGTRVERLAGTDTPAEHPTNWRQVLRLFNAHLRRPTHTYSWPNRRFPEAIGRIPGRRFRGSEGHHPSLLVAIDTSGSMDTSELVEIGRSLAGLARAARVVVVECDAAIQRVYSYRGSLPTVSGRGGTDLRPVFAESFLRRLPADGIVYFTDGEGPYPPSPPNLPVLWVLTGPSAFSCPWGMRVYLGEPG